jgi:hypothetical protein
MQQDGISWVGFRVESLGFFVDLPFRLQYGTGVDSVSNRNKYQGYILGSKGTRK